MHFSSNGFRFWAQYCVSRVRLLYWRGITIYGVILQSYILKYEDKGCPQYQSLSGWRDGSQVKRWLMVECQPMKEEHLEHHCDQEEQLSHIPGTHTLGQLRSLLPHIHERIEWLPYDSYHECELTSTEELSFIIESLATGSFMYLTIHQSQQGFTENLWQWTGFCLFSRSPLKRRRWRTYRHKPKWCESGWDG